MLALRYLAVDDVDDAQNAERSVACSGINI